MKKRHFSISDRLVRAAVAMLGGLILFGVLQSGYRSLYGEQTSDMVLMPRPADSAGSRDRSEKVQTASLPVGFRVSKSKPSVKRVSTRTHVDHAVTVYDDEGNAIGTIPAGANIDRFDAQGGWVDVQLADGRVGRVRTGDLNSNSADSNVTVASNEREINEGGIGTSSTLTISEILNEGTLIILSNGQSFRIESLDIEIASDWQVGNRVTIRETDNGTVLHNTDADEEVRSTPSERSSYRITRNDL